MNGLFGVFRLELERVFGKGGKPDSLRRNGENFGFAGNGGGDSDEFFFVQGVELVVGEKNGGRGIFKSLSDGNGEAGAAQDDALRRGIQCGDAAR